MFARKLKNMKSIARLFALIFATILVTQCVKEEFDKPPIGQIPVGTVLDIAELRQIFADSGEYRFEKDYSVYATVTMDESTGNIFRSAYIQDTSGGINLYLKEPGGLRIGDLIRVYLKGCLLSDYNGLNQIADVHNDSNIIIRATEEYVSPRIMTIPGILGGGYQAQLIRLENVQFKNSELGKTYADPSGPANRILEDCDGNEIIVRTSDYASFAEDTLPRGNGSLIAVVSQYAETWQLLIRTTLEVNLDGERCGGGGGGLEQISISDVRDMYSGSLMNLPSGKKIIGVITSDKEHNNLPGSNAFIQETSGEGIAVRFTNWHDLPMGALVEIDVSGLELSEFKGLLQINEIPPDRATITGTGTMPAPVEISIGDLLADYENYEAMLVQLSDVQISSPGGYTTYKWTTVLDDGTGEINMYTYEYADFADESFPTETVTVTGIASYYDDPQISIRNLSDVEETGGGGGGSVTSLDEDFEDQANNVDIDIDGWLNVAIKGTRLWRGKEFSGNTYAQATSYNGGEENVCWLITPSIDLDAMASPKLEFETAYAFWEHDGLSVYVSTDFDGTNVEAATWTALNADIAGSTDPEHAWIPSGVIDLSSYSGTGYIGFKYEGNDIAGLTTSYRVDNVRLYE